MLSALLSVVVATSPGPARLAATTMTLVDVPEAKGRFFEQQLVQELSLRDGLKVTSAEDVGRLLGLERQRALLGCAATSCVAELAGALGADAVLASTLAHVGSSWTLSVRVNEATHAEAVSVFTARASSEEAVLGLLGAAADKVRDDLERWRRGPAPSVRSRAWVPLVAGVLCAGAGGVAFGLSRAEAARFETGAGFVTGADVHAAATTGALEQTLGVVGLGVGAAALVTGGVMALLGGEPASETVAVGPASSGLGVAVRW